MGADEKGGKGGGESILKYSQGGVVGTKWGFH